MYDLGCGLEEPVLSKILEEISKKQNLPLEDSAAGVEVICRGTGEDRVRMVINHNAQEAVYDGKPVAPFQCWVEPAAE